jgi:hypothetical protein
MGSMEKVPISQGFFLGYSWAIRLDEEGLR